MESRVPLWREGEQKVRGLGDKVKEKNLPPKSICVNELCCLISFCLRQCVCLIVLRRHLALSGSVS